MALHVIIGADDYLVETAAKRIIGSGEGLETIDSLNSTNEELRLADLRAAEAAYFTPPFLEPRKVTWWKNVGFLPCGGSKKGDDEDKTSEAVKLALEKLVDRLVASPPPDNQEFIISGPRLLASSKVAKALKGAGEMLVLAAPSPWDRGQTSAARVAEAAKERSLAFAPGALERFVAIVGDDARSQMSELDKLAAYLGPKGGAATVDDVNEITSEGVGVEAAAWDVSDALGERNAAKLVAALERFGREGGFAIRVTNEVEKMFRQLCALKDATSKGQASAALEGLAPFVARKLGRFLPKWTLAELRVARARFLRLRERCVTMSDSVDALVAVELMAVVKRSGG